MKPDAPWFVLRNILIILEKVGADHSEHAVESFLNHPDGRVRAAAVGAYVRVKGPAGGNKLGRMFGDSDAHVIETLVERLGGMQSCHPQLLDLYRRVFDPEKEEAYPETLRRVACTAIAKTGNVALTNDIDTEDLLCNVLRGHVRTVLGLVVSRKPYFSPTVRSMICDALAQIGGEMARKALEEIEKHGDEDAPHARRALQTMKAKGK